MTNVPGIFAVGDVTGGMMLAHRAMQQGKILADRLCGGREIRSGKRRSPPSSIPIPRSPGSG